jgi:hypothetical protein
LGRLRPLLFGQIKQYFAIAISPVIRIPYIYGVTAKDVISRTVLLWVERITYTVEVQPFFNLVKYEAGEVVGLQLLPLV